MSWKQKRPVKKRSDSITVISEMPGSSSLSAGAPRAQPLKCNLVIPRRRIDNSILLAQKARGFGQGKWTGFGGKLEPGETIEESALREMAEETGVALKPDQISKIGLVLFSFECKPELFIEMHVYETFAVSSVPALCDEFHPPCTWFVEKGIPFAKAWPDFALWAGLVLRGQRFRARIGYSDFNTVTTSKIITDIDESDSLLADEYWTCPGASSKAVTVEPGSC